MRPVVVAVIVSSVGGGGRTASGQDAPATAELYRAKCAQCHLADGNAPLEPLNFTDAKWTHGSKPDAVAKVIAEGLPGTAMLPFKAQLTPKQVADLAAHVRAFDKSLKAGKSGRR